MTKQKYKHLSENFLLRGFLVSVGLAFVALFIIIPILYIFTQALSNGVVVYFTAITNPEALEAIKLSFAITLISVICNLSFGIGAAWCITKFRFFGRRLLLTLIDLPFSIAPVISGFCIILFYTSGWGSVANKLGIDVVFALPGMLAATIFVTMPIIARELMPILENQGYEEEEAAIMLGASGWQTIKYITLPNIKWGLVYGVLLSSARAMGEFGAVSVVSGHIRGLTQTIPLHVEELYNEYNFDAAFSVSSLLVLFAFATLIVKAIAKMLTEGK